MTLFIFCLPVSLPHLTDADSNKGRLAKAIVKGLGGGSGQQSLDVLKLILSNLEEYFYLQN